MDINLTAIAFLSTFLLSALHLGSPTTSGVVVPNLVMGALWGRILERVLASSLYMEVRNCTYMTVDGTLIINITRATCRE